MTIPFHDLPQDHFPFIIELMEHDTGKVVDRIRVEGPGALHIKGQPTPTDTCITYANGDWVYATHDSKIMGRDDD